MELVYMDCKKKQKAVTLTPKDVSRLSVCRWLRPPQLDHEIAAVVQEARTMAASGVKTLAKAATAKTTAAKKVNKRADAAVCAAIDMFK